MVFKALVRYPISGTIAGSWKEVLGSQVKAGDRHGRFLFAECSEYLINGEF